MSQKIKKRAFEILNATSSTDLSGRAFTIFIISLISLNVLTVMLETVESISSRHALFFNLFEVFSVGIFTVEYALRLWACTVDTEFSGTVRGRVRYALTPMALIDLAAILPFYLPMVVSFDLRILRALRLFRLFRLFKVGRYSEVMNMFVNVLREKREELFVSVFLIFIALVISSSLMYFIEHDAQPRAFSSIPAAMWWGIITLATIGYGDVYPITDLGKFFGAIVALLGIAMFALPAGIFASGFSEEIQKRQQKKQRVCPHCGKKID